MRLYAPTTWVARITEVTATLMNNLEGGVEAAMELAEVAAPNTMPATTTFNPNGSITTVYGAPINATVTTTFNPDGSIVESFGSPIGKTRTTTFGADGSVSEVVV